MLEWVVSSAVLTALIIVLRFVLKGKISLRLQYALWALVLLRLLVPVSFGGTGISVSNLTQKAAETETVQTVSALTQLELPRMTYNAAYSEVAKEYAEKGIDIAEMPVEEYERVEYEILSRMGGAWSIRDILKAVWILGIAAVGFVLLVSNIRFAAKLKKSRRRLDGQAYPLPVYVSPDVDTPCLFGLFRPTVYITPEAAADDTILRHTTQHELTHYRHGDHIWSLLRGACLALHWYNPLVWWAAILSRNDAELACDEATIKRIGENERAEYGRTLIGMTCQKRSALLLTATTMTGSKNSIKERIMLIVKKPKTAIYTLVAVLLIAAVAVGCTFTGAKKEYESTDLSIKVEVNDSVPQAVIDYAADYTQTQLEYYTNDLGYDITEAKIVGLTQINTGTARLDNGINMYCLEYRLLAADPEEVMLVGGMQMEGDYITEWGSTGQPYLLLHWQDNDSETMWERICVTNSDIITADYGTPEMIEQYGDMYTAAAMELYKKHESGGDTSPTDAIDSLFASGDIALTLNLANDGAYNTYLADEWYSGRFKVLLDGYKWTELEMPLTEPSDFWLTAASADGAKSMTFWANSGAGMVQYNDGNTTAYWNASPANEYNKSIAEDIRLEYDNLDVDYARIAFYLDGSAEEAADSFVHSAYGSHMMSLVPGNMYGMSDYEVVRWEAREVSENGDAVVGRFEYAFTPWDYNSIGIWAGNTVEGTGVYEGKLTCYREFVLQRQEDGYWHCVDLCTGGASLPE